MPTFKIWFSQLKSQEKMSYLELFSPPEDWQDLFEYGATTARKEGNAMSQFDKAALCTALLSSLLVAQQLRAQNTPIPSFYREVGRQVSISVHQEVRGFSEKLFFLDTDPKIFAQSAEWFSFWDADIWVCFIRDPRKIERISGIPEYLGEQTGGMQSDDYSTRSIITLGERRVLIQFFNLLDSKTINFFFNAVAECETDN